jgi:hypothetical protein
MLEVVSFCEHSDAAIDELPDSRLLPSLPYAKYRMQRVKKHYLIVTPTPVYPK